LPSLSISRLSTLAIVYSLALGLVGIFIFMPLTFILPLTTIAQILMLRFGQMLPILILTWRIGKKANISIKQILAGPFKRKNELIRHICLGGILSIVLYLLIYLSIGLNYFAIVPALNKIIFVPMYVVIEFFILLVASIYMNAILQNKYEKGIKGQFKSGLLIYGIDMIYMTTYLLLLSILQGSFFTFGVFMPIVILVTLLSSFVAVIAYNKTGNIITGSVVNAIIVVLITCTVSLL